MSLTRADFTLEPAKLRLKDGREVTLRRISALERAEYLGLSKQLGDKYKDGSPQEQLKAVYTAAGALVALTLIDDSGERVFASGEEAASVLSEPLMDELCDLATELNGFGKANRPNA